VGVPRFGTLQIRYAVPLSGPITPVLEPRKKGPTTVLQFQKSLTIHAPVEQVFAYVADRSHLTTIWPSLIAIKDLKPLANGGSAFKYVYKMVGLQFEGMGQDTTYVAKEEIVTEITGDLVGTLTFRFEPAAANTKVHFAFTYTAPVALLRQASESYIAKLNEQEAELVLQNLQAHFAVGVAAPSAR
jgi:uncharacterized membrane protein